MIEIISAERCTGCNICVSACPTRVFDAQPGGIPRIARQQDCQTCFMCELYCPADALYVAPVADHASAVSEQGAEAQAWMGSYRRAVGWGKDRTPTAAQDASFELLNRAH